MKRTADYVLAEQKVKKVRKGTKSCLECKRRKIRCTFAGPQSETARICDGCRSRRLQCIPVADEPETPSAGNPERLVEVDGRGTANTSCSTSFTLTLENKKLGNISCTLAAAWPISNDLHLLLSRSKASLSVLFHGVVCVPYSTLMSKNTGTFRHMSSIDQILELPSPDSHPVLIARKLLLLGSLLQGSPPDCLDEVPGMGIDRIRKVMIQVVDTARRLVTLDDSLIGSIESIECIMIESMYYNNGGSLRRAWLTNRRAMTFAQMMGLHLRDRGSMKFHVLDGKTRERIDPVCMWQRIVTTDRYLSLILGLPQGWPHPAADFESLDYNSLQPEIESKSPLDRLERVVSAVGGLLLERKSRNLYDLEAAQKMDRTLQNVADEMPPQWWLMPDLADVTNTRNDMDAFSETLRLMSQFAHFHLLAQVHFPYMLSPTADQWCIGSIMTAVQASREILVRFIHLRSHTSAVYCRGIDFLAFIATTALCIAYIHAQKKDISLVISQFLSHQRPSDRGLLERTLKILEELAQQSGDAIALKIVTVLRPLLAIEAVVSRGGCEFSYNAGISTSDSVSETLGPRVSHSEQGETLGHAVDTLRIPVPGIGMVEITKTVSSGTGSRQDPKGLDNLERWHPLEQPLSVPCELDFLESIGASMIDTSQRLIDMPSSYPFPPSTRVLDVSAHNDYVGTDDSILQGVDMALFDSLMHRWLPSNMEESSEK